MPYAVCLLYVVASRKRRELMRYLAGTNSGGNEDGAGGAGDSDGEASPQSPMTSGSPVGKQVGGGITTSFSRPRSC